MFSKQCLLFHLVSHLANWVLDMCWLLFTVVLTINVTRNCALFCEVITMIRWRSYALRITLSSSSFHVNGIMMVIEGRLDPARLNLFFLLSQLIIWNSGRLECSRLDPEQRLCALSNLCTVYCALYCFVGNPIFPFPWAVVSAIRSVSGKITQLSHSSALHFESCFAHSLQ